MRAINFFVLLIHQPKTWRIIPQIVVNKYLFLCDFERLKQQNTGQEIFCFE